MKCPMQGLTMEENNRASSKQWTDATGLFPREATHERLRLPMFSIEKETPLHLGSASTPDYILT